MLATSVPGARVSAVGVTGGLADSVRMPAEGVTVVAGSVGVDVAVEVGVLVGVGVGEAVPVGAGFAVAANVAVVVRVGARVEVGAGVGRPKIVPSRCAE
jgi:hypothetical protein